MEEIKFRAWDKANKIFQYFTLWEFFAIGSTYWENEWAKEDNLIITKFTGLKDKNGKEIYCGDIVCNSYNKNKIGEIFWNEKGTWAVHWNREAKGENGWLWIYGCSGKLELEIIGNIFESPELFEK